MIHVEYDEIDDKAKMRVEGSLGQIYAELGLIIKSISNQEDLEMTVDDVLDMSKVNINEHIKNVEIK